MRTELIEHPAAGDESAPGRLHQLCILDRYVLGRRDHVISQSTYWARFVELTYDSTGINEARTIGI